MKAYRFKITVRGSRPPIWRRLEVPATMSFLSFADIIQTLFGFSGYHLDEFRFPGADWCMTREELDSWYEEKFMNEHCLEEAETYRHFTYLYDFGDGWEFKIDQEAVIPSYGLNTPVLKKYKGDNLVEDIGGLWGYYEWLEQMNGKTREEAEKEDDDLYWGHPDDFRFDADYIEGYLEQFDCPESFDGNEEAKEELEADKIDEQDIRKFLDRLGEILDEDYMPADKESLEFMLMAHATTDTYAKLKNISKTMDIPMDDLIRAARFEKDQIMVLALLNMEPENEK